MHCIKCNGDLELKDGAIIPQEFNGVRLLVLCPAFQCVVCGSHYLREGGELRRRTQEEYQKHLLKGAPFHAPVAKI